MFAGHIGAALAIGRAERRINIGVLVFAALLLDAVLWLLILLGWEFVNIPADFASTHQPEFVFPLSHGLLASLAWSALAGAVTFFGLSSSSLAVKVRAAGLVAAAVFSHWLLDALVHAPELPLAGAGSMKVGLGLWHSMPLALAVEGAIAAVGLSLFLAGATMSRPKKLSLALLLLLVLVFTIAGMTVAPPPPSASAMAASSLLMIALVCILVGWLGKPSAGAKA